MSRPRAKRVGLKDVAQAAGVAVSTASDALNERGRVAAATRQRVRGAAKELGYVPNAAGRGLRAGTSRLIGLALRLDVSAPDRYPVDLYYSLLITACATTAGQRGYAVALLPEKAMDLAAELPLAALFVSDTAEQHPALAQAHTLGIPIVTEHRPAAARSAVTLDNVRGAVSLVNDHLLAAGARRIGLLSVRPTNSAFAGRWELNHTRWCEKRGHEVVVDGGPSDDPNEDPSYESDPLLAAAMRLLSKDCDAIVGLPIGAGPAVLKAAAARGSRVPADVMLAVVDEDPDWADANPPLTALSLNPIGTAIQLTDLVIDVIEGKVAAPVELFIPAHLIVRASTQR